MNEADKIFQEKLDKRISLIRAMNAIFNTEEGELVLRDLKDVFVNRVRFSLSDDYNNCIKHAFYNEGAAAVVYYIENIMKQDINKLQGK